MLADMFCVKVAVARFVTDERGWCWSSASLPSAFRAFWGPRVYVNSMNYFTVLWEHDDALYLVD